MLRTLAILCLVAAPALAIWEKGLTCTWGLTVTPGDKYFIKLPENTTEASSSSWEEVTPPTQKPGYESATLWCPENNRSVCLLYDDTGYILGVQVSLNPNDCSVVQFDWKKAGFVQWNTTLSGVSITYWSHTAYFASAAYLNTSATTRVANRDSNYILQDKAYYVNCFGDLVAVPTDTTKMSSTNFTEESCIYGMGTHYFYNMSTSLTCGVDTVCTSFVLTYADQPAGVGFLLPANCTVPTGTRDYWEHPSESSIKTIVPNCPDCYSAYGTDPGVITFHLYFFKKAYQITCLAGLG